MTTSQPALICHPDASLRSLLATGLAQLGFEAIPVAADASLPRYFAALAPTLLIVPADLVGAPLLAELTVDPRQTTLVVLGDLLEAPPPWDAAIALATEGLSAAEWVRRLDLALLGRKLALAPDPHQASLVGSIAQVPFLEVVQRLALVQFTGRLQLAPQEVVFFAAGAPLAAMALPTSGIKAFCRLAQRQEGTFWIVPGQPTVEPNLQASLDTLLQAAVMDNLGQPLDPRATLCLHLGNGFFEQEFSPLEKELLTQAQRNAVFQDALDASTATDGELTRAAHRLVSRGFLKLQAPAARIRVVTDSTADLPPELVRQEAITVVPLTVRFGDKVLRDRVDLQPRQFYELLAKGGPHPMSSPPTPAFFSDVYQSLLDKSDVLSVHLSSKLSLTYTNACEAAKNHRVRRANGDSPKIEVIDSRHCGLTLGLLAIFANRLAARGEEVPAIAARLREIVPRLRMLFAVDTLEFLVRGGRLSRTRGFLGSMFGIKPILEVIDGEIVPLDRVRGGRAVQPKLLELALRGLDPKQPVFGCILHANAPAWAENMRQLASQKLEFRELLIGEMGPVVGTHAGPGTIGFGIFQPKPDELALLSPL